MYKRDIDSELYKSVARDLIYIANNLQPISRCVEFERSAIDDLLVKADKKGNYAAHKLIDNKRFSDKLDSLYNEFKIETNTPYRKVDTHFFDLMVKCEDLFPGILKGENILL